ncbi:hypothetical protein IHE44_0014576 [Lamprotornis superbus]|uniref:JmjC domain-containing protein n=1 Tax=Lamprotornis superbus TaxID=245042 RepID=A0A835TZE3_9PASS|nr:hypothetical protein IHE44_0014576 [Lamprotornis superbus]
MIDLLVAAPARAPVSADGLCAFSDPPPLGEDVKPFTPEKTKEIVMSLQQPAVFCNMVGNWPALHWNVNYLSAVLEGKTIQFRLGLKTVDLVPQFETSCSYVEATLEEFLAWSCGQPSCLSGPFSCYDYSKYWAYADYKYIARIFEDKPEIFQILFRFTKRWHLFPPGDTSFLYPTRIPYEESSIFSKVNIANPDLKRFPDFRNSTAHVVTLSPGQVLLVPRHWWHYVESIDPVTVSINSWIELISAETYELMYLLKPSVLLRQDADHEARVEEAITRMLVCAIKSAENPSDGDLWLNPTEVEATSHEINLQYLNKAVSAYLKCQEASVSGQARSSSTGTKQRTNASCKRKRKEVGCEPGSCTLLTQECDFPTPKAEELQEIPFGPHLIQVLPQSHKTSVMGVVAVESDSGDLHENEGEHFGRLKCKRDRLLMSNDCETAAHQMDSDCGPCTSQTALSTNDLLDCLVNPRVISLVAQLLLERMRTSLITYEGLGTLPVLQPLLPQGGNGLPLHLLGALGALSKGIRISVVVKNGAFCYGVIAHCNVVYSLTGSCSIAMISVTDCMKFTPALAMAGISSHGASSPMSHPGVVP